MKKRDDGQGGIEVGMVMGKKRRDVGRKDEDWERDDGKEESRSGRE